MSWTLDRLAEIQFIMAYGGFAPVGEIWRRLERAKEYLLRRMERGQ